MEDNKNIVEEMADVMDITIEEQIESAPQKSFGQKLGQAAIIVGGSYLAYKGIKWIYNKYKASKEPKEIEAEVVSVTDADDDCEVEG